MVQFGGHVEAVREGDFKGTELYLVPYNVIKALIFEEAPDVFCDRWHEALSRSEDDFRCVRTEVWKSVFAEIDSRCEGESIRGAHPGNALQVFADCVHPDKTRALLLRMNQMHRAATTNSEALRKLVKKFDKYNHQHHLTVTLMPELYTSSLYAGQNMVQDCIGLLRELVEKTSQEFAPMIRLNSDANHQRAAEIRFEEYDWLKRLVCSIQADNPRILSSLVAHRGFHHIKDRNDKRPLENSLSAYEMAWAAGIQLCECDIALTKDEKLVLAHDENFMRLALDSNSESSKKKVSDLTFRELLSMPLRSGIRPPLLIDVLRSACAISDHARLIIEIKPGNEAAASALARLLIRHQDLRKAVAMIMSFDAVTMHRLRAELNVVAALEQAADPSSLAPSAPLGVHHRVTSFDHFGTMGSFLGSHTLMTNHDQVNNNSASIGLSLSSTHLLYEDQAAPEGDIGARNQNNLDLPKLMLLTVADPPKRPCELRVSVEDLSPVYNWLRTDDGCLDGVYMQYENDMLTPEGLENLRTLSKDHLVGVWAYSGKDPDEFSTVQRLVVEGNCTYVNTDLPNHFRREVFVRSGSS